MIKNPWAAAAAIALLSTTGPAAGQTAASVALPLDAPTQVNGVDVVCTGIGRAVRDDPRWAAYGVRVEFSNARSEYLPAADVTVRDKANRTVLSVQCEAPWVLMRLTPGAYKVEGRQAGAQTAPRSAPFTAPAKGQLRVVLQFPDA